MMQLLLPDSCVKCYSRTKSARIRINDVATFTHSGTVCVITSTDTGSYVYKTYVVFKSMVFNAAVRYKTCWTMRDRKKLPAFLICGKQKYG